jgi:hypothetical protein
MERRQNWENVTKTPMGYHAVWEKSTIFSETPAAWIFRTSSKQRKKIRYSCRERLCHLNRHITPFLVTFSCACNLHYRTAYNFAVPSWRWVHQFPPNVGTFCQTTRCYTADISLREHLKSQTLLITILMLLKVFSYKVLSRYSFSDGNNKIMNMAVEIFRML